MNLIQTRTQLQDALAMATTLDEKEITILASLEFEINDQRPTNAMLIHQIKDHGITVRKKALIRLINKPKRAKWFKVIVDWQYEKDQELARFRHAGDAYNYAANLQDESPKYAEPLLEIRVDC